MSSCSETAWLINWSFMGKEGKEKKSGLSGSFVTGAVAMVFLVIGYQTALFVHSAAVTRIAANRDCPDTVFVYREEKAGAAVADKIESSVVERRNASHSPRVTAVRSSVPFRSVENFRFDPNTVSEEDLCRLGFSPKQARSIANYRAKGGRFRRKGDFAKSFVVSDSIYRRLEPYIDIPLIDVNTADSAAFDSLPGIGGWFASRIVSHRKALGGYSNLEQLMDIKGLDRDKFEGLRDLVTISEESITPYPIWNLPADSLKQHPYVGNNETACAIVLYRQNNPPVLCTVEALESSGIISCENALKLAGCRLVPP